MAQSPLRAAVSYHPLNLPRTAIPSRTAPLPFLLPQRVHNLRCHQMLCLEQGQVTRPSLTTGQRRQLAKTNAGHFHAFLLYPSPTVFHSPSSMRFASRFHIGGTTHFYRLAHT